MFKKLTKISLLLVFLFPAFLFAAVMQSSSYKIQSDSINVGGIRSTSSSYIEEDTVGEVGTGTSSSPSYRLSAGYQAMQQVYISITDSADFALPNMGGISGGNSAGSSIWTVVTDDPAGYQLTVAAGTVPALRSASSTFTDYVPAGGATPDFAFTVGAASSTFGFSPEGVDITSLYKDNGSVCNSGSGNTIDRCWNGLSTTPKIIASSNTSNHPSGATTTIKYQAGVGSSKIQDAGTYTATVTVTAIAL